MAATKDIDTGEVRTFFHPFNDLVEFLKNCTRIVGHNFLGFDGPVLKKLLNADFNYDCVVDTIVVSRFLNFNIEGGHGLEAWGKRLNYPKLNFDDYSQLTPEMVKYCIGDVELTYRVYKRFEKYIDNNRFQKALKTEHDIVLICNQMRENGFYFNKGRALELQNEIQQELNTLDASISNSFRPRIVPGVSTTIRYNRDGNLAHSIISKYRDQLAILSEIHGERHSIVFSPGAEIQWFTVEPFNPASPKQIVERLNEAGWKPVDKTKGHIQAERDLKQCRDRIKREELKTKLEHYKIYGWKVNEENLETLPEDAPASARTLARRILLASRLSSLNEWLSALKDDGAIHGSVFPIGAWTHRMSHFDPNTANIASEYNRKGQVSLYGKDFRKLWGARPGRKLVGTDAEGIQLRILAHYINDPEFTFGLVSGDKSKGTDIHSMNKRALGLSLIHI
jgi:DNA polymerase-1